MVVVTMLFCLMLLQWLITRLVLALVLVVTCCGPQVPM